MRNKECRDAGFRKWEGRTGFGGALGIGAASFWSVSGKRYSGKPDGVAGTPKRIHNL